MRAVGDAKKGAGILRDKRTRIGDPLQKKVMEKLLEDVQVTGGGRRRPSPPPKPPPLPLPPQPTDTVAAPDAPNTPSATAATG